MSMKRKELPEDPESVPVFSPAATLEEKSRTAAESKLERIYPTEVIARGLGSPPPEAKKPEEAEAKGKPDPLGKLPGSMFCAVPTAFETRKRWVTPVRVDRAQ
jgi:hypothetical protein